MKPDTPCIIKACGVCGNDFETRTRQRRYCDKCQKIKNRLAAHRWAANHPEEYNAYQRNWQAQNRDDREVYAVMNKNGTDLWEFHERRLPMNVIRKMAHDGNVDGLLVEWRGKTFEAKNRTLVEVME